MTPTPGSYTAGQSVNMAGSPRGSPQRQDHRQSLLHHQNQRAERSAHRQPDDYHQRRRYVHLEHDGTSPGGAYYIAATLTSGGATFGPYFTKTITVARRRPPRSSRPDAGPTISGVAVDLANDSVSWTENGRQRDCRGPALHRRRSASKSMPSPDHIRPLGRELHGRLRQADRRHPQLPDHRHRSVGQGELEIRLVHRAVSSNAAQTTSNAVATTSNAAQRPATPVRRSAP